MIHGLHPRFKGGRFLAVIGIIHPRDNGRGGGYGTGLGQGRAYGILQPGYSAAVLLQSLHVFGRADIHQVDGTSLL